MACTDSYSMADNMTNCPKCGHSQNGGTECEACGIIFSRYEEFKQRQQAREAVHSEKKESPKKKNYGMFLMMAVVAVLTASATYYFTRSADNNLPGSQPEYSARQEEGEMPDFYEAGGDTAIDLPVSDKIVSSAGATIREARSATVSIKTPMGTGSGFFIAEGNIVTNRHVVEVDPEIVAELRRNVETGRQLIELEKKKLWDYRERLRKMPSGPARRQVEIIVEERERGLDQILPRQEEAERRLSMMELKIRPSDIEIILEGGESYSANDMAVSEEHDLALLYLYIPDQHFLTPPPSNKQIRQGDKVYTIGSPSGLRNTVTSGIFSGFRKRESDGQILLQTDAPINPGNSGGPLIDEDGYVLGVNTSILRDTEGIGFAIPIDTVFEEFSVSSY